MPFYSTVGEPFCDLISVSVAGISTSAITLLMEEGVIHASMRETAPARVDQAHGHVQRLVQQSSKK